jgi:hypothetical protein
MIGNLRWIKLMRYISAFHVFEQPWLLGQLLTFLDARTIFS